MIKKTNKTTFKRAMETQIALGYSEEDAKQQVQKLIELGLVGDPSKRKTKSWPFAGTLATFYSPSSKPKTGDKNGKIGDSNNIVTGEMKLVSSLLEAGYSSVMDFVKTIHLEGQLKSYTPEQMVLRFKSAIESEAKEGMLKFLSEEK